MPGHTCENCLFVNECDSLPLDDETRCDMWSPSSDCQTMANAAAQDRIENDETLTDDEKRRYLRDLADELDEVERNFYPHEYR